LIRTAFLLCILVWVRKEREEGKPIRVRGERRGKVEKVLVFSFELRGEPEMRCLAPLLSISWFTSSSGLRNVQMQCTPPIVFTDNVIICVILSPL
jgi:hypothetical protein